MRTPRYRGWACAPLALSATLVLLGNPPLHAQDTTAAKPSSSALGAALQITRTRGAATIAILTSSAQPSSVGFWKEFYDGAWARTNRGIVQVVNVSKDAEPDVVRAMGVSHFPTVIVYGRGPHGVSQLGTIADCDTPAALIERLRSFDLGINPPARADRAVSQTALGHDVYATQQAQPPPPVSSPPVAAPAPQPVSLTPSVQTTASLIQMPSQNLMIQQAPPQIFLAPTQAPIVYVPQMQSGVPSTPALTLGTAPASSAPAANLFLTTTPSVAAIPAQQPTVALATTNAAPQPTAALAVSTGATTPALAVTNQTLALPTSGTRTRVSVTGPGFIGLGLSRLGERMMRLGRARIRTVQETTLEAPTNQAPGVGMTTISTTSTTPVSQPPTTSLAPPTQQPPCQTSCPNPSSCPPSNLPSPQRQTGHGN
jgi:hypothetical protein